MTLYTYILVHDAGFAPNPFFGYCTLACCKPVIRRVAKKGDWVTGFSRKNQGNKLIYTMELTEEPIAFSEYFLTRKYDCKKPNFRSIVPKYIVGDNIYKPIGRNQFQQQRSLHSISNAKLNKKKDLSGKFVLISMKFYYFGQNPVDLPKSLSPIVPNQGHRSVSNSPYALPFIKFIQSNRKKGRIGNPTIWPPKVRLTNNKLRCN